MEQVDQIARSAEPTSGLPRVARTLLKDQVGDLLRARILSGRLPPGTPLIERELAQQMGVSRIPVRAALLQLETEGLVSGRPNGRNVIQLTERDIYELYQVRLVLEKLAARLAASCECGQGRAALSVDGEGRTALLALVEQMRSAVAARRHEEYLESDIGIHRLIWEASGNRQLAKVLGTMLGPILMLAARHAGHYDWAETLHLHEGLAERILAGDALGAEESMEHHIDNARRRSVELYRQGWL